MNKENEQIDNKIKRILKDYNLEKRDGISKEELFEICGKFKNSLLSQRTEYKDLLSQVETANEEIKKYIKEIEQNKEIIAVNSRLAGIGEMVSSLSHEINNPLMVLSLEVAKYQMFLVKNINNSDIVLSKFENTYARVNNTIGKITDIIDAVKRLSYDGTSSNLQKNDLNKIIRQTVSLVEDGCKSLNIEFNINFSNKEYFVYSNEVLLSQVLFNLVQNAKHAVENLSNKWIQINVKDVKSNVFVEISNSGDGIPEKIQEKIFEPFFTTKPVGKGTGIGLSISKKIMNSFDGDLILNKSKKYPSFTLSFKKDA